MMPLKSRLLLASQYLGYMGISGLLLVSVALGIWLLGIVPLQYQLSEKNAKDNIIEAVPKNQPANHSQQIDDELAQFYHRFPSAQEYAPQLAHLYQVAQKEGLLLAEGEYRVVREGDGHNLVHYQLTLPVKGTYVQVRNFLRRIFTEMPTITLEHITLQRLAISDSGVDARLDFVWYLKNK